jgi:hypothetical protein
LPATTVRSPDSRPDLRREPLAVGHAREPLGEHHGFAAPASRAAARSMSQQSHIGIEAAHYDRAVQAIASVAVRT